MNIVANRLNLIKPSPTLAVTQKAAELKAEGKNIISLGAGEPDFDTPENIKKAGINAIEKGKTKYTPVSGIDELKDAIIHKMRRDCNLDYAKSEIIISTGAKQVIYNLFMATINPGDEVIIPSPYWVSYPDIVQLSEGKSIFIECPIENDFKLTAKQLENAITDKTKWLIMNSPNNPTGSVYTKEELIDISEVLKKHPNVLIMSDDIYEHILFDNSKFFNIAMANSEIKNRVFVVNGVSKGNAMTGWRIGFGAGDKNIIKAMDMLQSQSTSNASSISQYAAIEAFLGTQDYIPTNAKKFEEKRDLCLKILTSINGVKCNVPKGAFYIFASIEELIGKEDSNGKKINNCNDFANYLMEDAEVAVVPGIAFGMKNHFRVSIATNIKTLEEACTRIKNSCEKLTK